MSVYHFVVLKCTSYSKQLYRTLANSMFSWSVEPCTDTYRNIYTYPAILWCKLSLRVEGSLWFLCSPRNRAMGIAGALIPLPVPGFSVLGRLFHGLTVRPNWVPAKPVASAWECGKTELTDFRVFLSLSF